MKVYRVMGGYSPHPKESHYHIRIYEMERETARYYYERTGYGSIKLHQKRTTANSAWYETTDEALAALIRKVDDAIEKIAESLGAVLTYSPPRHSFTRTLYVCKFKNEVFTIEEHKVVESEYRGARKGWRIENTKSRTGKIKRDAGYVDKTMSSGRSYIYEHQSQPHDFELPFERWVGLSWEQIQRMAEQYAHDRLRYFEQCKTDARKRFDAPMENER